MQIEFTQHALTRMAERGISPEVLATIANPIRTLSAGNERFEAQGWIDRATKRMMLRVIYENEVVVTAMATSKFEKYGVVP